LGKDQFISRWHNKGNTTREVLSMTRVVALALVVALLAGVVGTASAAEIAPSGRARAAHHPQGIPQEVRETFGYLKAAGEALGSEDVPGALKALADYVMAWDSLLDEKPQLARVGLRAQARAFNEILRRLPEAEARALLERLQPVLEEHARFWRAMIRLPESGDHDPLARLMGMDPARAERMLAASEERVQRLEANISRLEERIANTEDPEVISKLGRLLELLRLELRVATAQVERNDYLVELLRELKE